MGPYEKEGGGPGQGGEGGDYCEQRGFRVLPKVISATIPLLSWERLRQQPGAYQELSTICRAQNSATSFEAGSDFLRSVSVGQELGHCLSRSVASGPHKAAGRVLVGLARVEGSTGEGSPHAPVWFRGFPLCELLARGHPQFLAM